ncbi:MAG: hypothetical protein ACKV19_15535, partial [Verrucomicrobiales bacterium]
VVSVQWSVFSGQCSVVSVQWWEVGGRASRYSSHSSYLSHSYSPILARAGSFRAHSLSRATQMVVAADTARLPGSVGPLSGILNNICERVRLRNQNGRIMDEVE